MPDPIDFVPRGSNPGHEDRGDHEPPAVTRGVPSNEVYARVGDEVLRVAQEGIRRGDRPEDVIRDIHAGFNVHLTRGELRLLLASRRIGG